MPFLEGGKPKKLAQFYCFVYLYWSLNWTEKIICLNKESKYNLEVKFEAICQCIRWIYPIYFENLEWCSLKITSICLYDFVYTYFLKSHFVRNSKSAHRHAN